MFKAKVANLLNRLKEQLYLHKLRGAQELKEHSGNATAVPSVDSSMSDLFKGQSGQMGKSANSTLSNTEQMLAGLQRRLELLQAKSKEMEGIQQQERNASKKDGNEKPELLSPTPTTILPVSTTPSSSEITSTRIPSSSAENIDTPAATSSTATPSTSISSIRTQSTISSIPSTSSSSTTSSSSRTTLKPASSNGTANGTAADDGDAAFAFITESPEATPIVFVLNETATTAGEGEATSKAEGKSTIKGEADSGGRIKWWHFITFCQIEFEFIFQILSRQI
jgi:hypothetical protein